MKKIYIATIRVDDHNNGRDLAETVENMTFEVGKHLDTGSTLEVKRAMDNQVGTDDDNGFSVYSVDEFVEDFNNQHISDEAHWLCHVHVIFPD